MVETTGCYKSLLHKVEQLYSITRSLAKESDHNKLLEMTLEAAKKLTNADGGTLYTVTNDKRLSFAMMHSDTLGIKLGGNDSKAVNFEPLPLYLDNEPNLHNVACYSVLKDTVVNIPDAYFAENFDFSGTRKFDQQTGYRSKSFLTIPLKDHERDIIGALQLINARDANDRVMSFSIEDQKFCEFLASQAAITLTNYKLIQEQERLFLAFADVIASAIDDKSPHTGEHCKRVPVITMMLAEAAHKADWGPFKDFTMNEEDRHELHLAALLHDCGKITTPVHVIEKATKLQTITDRIQLVDTRFEVLKRDTEIAALKKRLATLESQEDPSFVDSVTQEFRQQVKQYDDDREFLHGCNIGGEFMKDDDIARVTKIAKYQWQGIEGQVESFLSFDELKNLTIRQGTLTAEEREIINRHIDVTIMMLEKLPYPTHLKRIPEFAGGHHERMDGKGRPRGLTREQMSLQARIMGVAEIYEALTAADRPYKKGKTLSESLQILGRMKQDQHIDPDVFQLLIESGVYLDYAHRYIDPSQIDNVKPENIPGFEGRFKEEDSSRQAS